VAIVQYTYLSALNTKIIAPELNRCNNNR